MNRLKTQYQEVIVPELMERFGFTSPMQVPRLEKITINAGVGEAIRDKKILDTVMKELSLLSGQKPVATLARRSIAGFKIRDGWPIGCKVTLRNWRMFDFLERLIHIAIPRIRDFRGLSVRSFDGQGNYSFGVKEQIIFPEIPFESIDQNRGFDICFTIRTTSVEASIALLRAFNFPLKDKD